MALVPGADAQRYVWRFDEQVDSNHNCEVRRRLYELTVKNKALRDKIIALLTSHPTRKPGDEAPTMDAAQRESALIGVVDRALKQRLSWPGSVV